MSIRIESWSQHWGNFKWFRLRFIHILHLNFQQELTFGNKNGDGSPDMDFMRALRGNSGEHDRLSGSFQPSTSKIWHMMSIWQYMIIIWLLYTFYFQHIFPSALEISSEKHWVGQSSRIPLGRIWSCRTSKSLDLLPPTRIAPKWRHESHEEYDGDFPWGISSKSPFWGWWSDHFKAWVTSGDKEVTLNGLGMGTMTRNHDQPLVFGATGYGLSSDIPT